MCYVNTQMVKRGRYLFEWKLKEKRAGNKTLR